MADNYRLSEKCTDDNHTTDESSIASGADEETVFTKKADNYRVSEKHTDDISTIEESPHASIGDGDIAFRKRVGKYRVSEKHTDDISIIEESSQANGGDGDTAPVPHVAAERKVTLEKVLAIFSVLLLVTFISLSVYYFITLNHKKEESEELINRNDILISKHSALLEAHATLQSQYARNYSTLQSLYTILKEKDDKLSRQFSYLKEFYCDATNTSPENICPVCKLGWVRFKSKCYLFSTEILNWYDSHDWCKKIGGNLVNIESSDELKFLRYQSNVMLRKTKYYWIGQNDISKENPTTKMDTGPVKSKRARVDCKEACCMIYMMKREVLTMICTNHIKWICESAVFLLRI